MKNPTPLIRLPSYAHTPTEQLEPLALADEAVDFFKKIVSAHGIAGAKEFFSNLKDSYPDVAWSRLLSQTLALALVKDIETVSAFLALGIVQANEISFEVRAFSKAHKVDLVRQLERKGPVSLDYFCRVYSVSSQDLALKVVLDDSAAGAAAFTGSDHGTLLLALSRIPYAPTSEIRAHLGQKPGEICDVEFEYRFDNQLLSLTRGGEFSLADPGEPSCLEPGHRICCSSTGGVDHHLEEVGGYFDFLARHHENLVNAFGAQCLNCVSPTIEQVSLIHKTMDHFERAGVSRVDILMMGVYNYGTLSASSYESTPDEFKQTLYKDMLIEDGAEYTEDTVVWFGQQRLLQITHFSRKEPIESMEALCTHPAHWHFLYRVTGDRKYLPLTKGRIDKVIAQDLGL